MIVWRPFFAHTNDLIKRSNTGRRPLFFSRRLWSDEFDYRRDNGERLRVESPEGPGR